MNIYRTKTYESSVLLEDAKIFLHEDRDIEDDLIEELITAVEDNILDHTGFAVRKADYEIQKTVFSDTVIPYKNVQEDSIKVVSDASELSTELYSIEKSRFGLFKVKFKDDTPDPINPKINFTAGYEAGDTPEKLITAIKVIAMIYHRREIDQDLNPLEIPIVKNLLTPFKHNRFQ